MTEQLLTISEAAQILQVSVATLRRWRADGIGPRSVLVGRGIRYRVSDLDTYLAGLGSR